MSAERRSIEEEIRFAEEIRRIGSLGLLKNMLRMNKSRGGCSAAFYIGIAVYIYNGKKYILTNMHKKCIIIPF